MGKVQEVSTPAERRRYPRFATELAGRVQLPEGGARPCVVRDYCRGGMLLQQPAAVRAVVDLRVGQEVQIQLDLASDQGIHSVSTPADVVWVHGDHVGIAFAEPADALVAALRRHDRAGPRGDNVARAPRGGETRNLARLRHVAQGMLPDLLRDLLAATLEELLAVAKRAPSDSEQQQIYTDISNLDNAQTAQLLTQSVLEQVTATGHDAGPAEPSADELTLVDRDEFERWLEASRVATVLEERLRPQLGRLVSRIADTGAPSQTALPFEPKHFATALNQVAKSLELGPATRRVLFDGATRVLGERLGAMYGAFDQVLDRLGAPRTPRPRDASPRRPARPPERGGGTVTALPNTVAASSDTGVADAQGLTAAGPSAGSLQLAIDPELLRALQARESQHRERLAHQLIERITQTPDMTDSLAGWLSVLGGPLVEEATADQGLFHDPEHPLRGILDGLVHLQMFRAVPDIDPDQDPLRQRISELLDPLREGAADAQALRSIAGSVGQIVDEQSRQYQRRVERVVEACEGRDRVRHARRAVAAELDRRYAGRRVPSVAIELLDVGWRTALELAWLNQVGDNRTYMDDLDVLDGIVAVLGGEAFAPEMARPEPQQLLVGVSRELETVAFDPFHRTALERRLRAELLDPAVRGLLVEMPPQSSGKGDEPADEYPQGVGPAAWEHALGLCAGVNIGDRLWFEERIGGSHVVTVVWIRDDGGLLALVDYRGVLVREIERRDLALGLLTRRIRWHKTDGKPVSERAVVSMLEQMQGRLSHQTAHDSLTGLINRRQFHALLEKALVPLSDDTGRGLLFWIDIDQFRLVNDVHGYDTGDRLLVALSRLIEQQGGDKVVGHVGGDRFAVLLHAAASEGEAWAQGLNQAVRSLSFDWKGQALGLSLSVGVVDLDQVEGGLGGALRAAENALSAAKAAGGDRLYVYREDDPDMRRRVESVHRVVQVDEALDNNRLHLRCQPIVPVRSDRGLVPHYEILLSVAGEPEDRLPIDAFIEAAERYNRIRAVDRWVAGQVVEWVAQHRDLMPSLHGFAVNLSGQTVSDPGFVDYVRALFQRTGIDPRWVSFEVTETAAVADLSRSAGIIRDLRGLGCKVALDDFGSGLASYAYLKELPVDWLKIDGAFVRKIADDRDDFAVVRSINEIGQFLGKQTIAEYVANDAILGCVREIGVDFAQGYAVSPPMPLDELPRSLGIAAEALKG